jgi:hypothetical protein
MFCFSRQMRCAEAWNVRPLGGAPEPVLACIDARDRLGERHRVVNGGRVRRRGIRCGEVRYRQRLHGISLRPTCFGAKPWTPAWVPVQLELTTERFGMAYRLLSPLGICLSGN